MPALLLRRKAEGLSNPFKLPRGERLRREVVQVFRSQRQAIFRYLRTGRKDQAGNIPFHWPNWHDFGLGALDISQRMTPLLTLTWEAAAAKFAPRVGLDPNQWDVVNPHTERMIADAALAFCDSTNETTSLALDEALEKTRRELHEGIVRQGESLEKLTKRVNRIFDGAERWRARRIAWTETSRAVHAAQEQAAIASGVVTGWRWLLSGDACPICFAIAARCPAVRLGHAFAVIGDDPHYSQIKFPPCHPHCCLPETPVVAPMRIAGMKAQYDGPVVRLHLSDGSDVTVTPNHMLLTPQGFALAGSLVEGNEVLRYGVGEGVSVGDPYDGHVPAPISEVFDTLAKAGGVAAGRVPVAPEYLHGDAALCQGDIDVVTTNRLLWHSLCAESFEPFLDGSLRWPHIGRTELAGKSEPAKALLALRDATDGGMGALREFKARLRAQAAVPIRRGGGTAADLDARFREAAANPRTGDPEGQGQGQFTLSEPVSPDEFFSIDCFSPLPAGFEGPAYLYAHRFEPSLDSVAADSERIRDCLGRLSGKVAACHVVSVERLHYCGPVYDITTATSLYLIGNGIVSSNCNCSMLEVLDTDDQPRWHDTLHQPEPATEDEHEAVARETQERDERTIAGSAAWGAESGPAGPERPRPPAARKPKPAAKPRPAPPKKPEKPPWRWGEPIDPDRPIAERIKASPAWGRAQELAKANEEYVSYRDAARAMNEAYDKLQSEAQAGLAAGSLTEAEKARFLAELKRTEDQYKLARRMRDAAKAAAADETARILALPPKTRAYAWDIDRSGVNADNKSAVANAERFVAGLVAAPKGDAYAAAGRGNPRTNPRLVGDKLAWKVIPAGKEQRAHCKDWLNEVWLSQQDSSSTAVHEWGHQIERSVPGVREATDEFLKHRVGPEPLRKLNDIFPGKRYKDDEEGREDDFGKAFGEHRWYVGKHYAGASEIISMGLEKLYSDPGGFAKADPEYCAFILGILDGSLRKP